MKKLILALLIALTATTTTTPALAVNPDEVLKDPVLETRARELSKEIRCVVCQNQSIDDSDAELARDLRVLVRERLTKGDSDDEVLDFLVTRYGDFVLLKPPLKGITYALWFGPPLILILGLFAVMGYFRNRASEAKASVAKPLSAEEQKRLDQLLGGKDGQ
jgi:cytochrome c-type biogenesis protein CcmH